MHAVGYDGNFVVLVIYPVMAKGRDKNLISKRDEWLLRRYYYWTEIQRRRFDDVLKILSEQEFFISEARIMAIIRKGAQGGEGSDPYSPGGGDGPEIKPVPKVKMPRISSRQLTLFPGE